MKFLIVIYLTIFGSTAQAHLKVFDLQTSAYCLAHSRYKFIEKNNRIIHINAIETTVSNSKERHLFIFTARKNGAIEGFDIRVHIIGSNTHYDIVNNGSFNIIRARVNWVHPTLGGVWTQNNFENNFWATTYNREIAVTLPTKLPPKSVCSAYADKTANR